MVVSEIVLSSYYGKPVCLKEMGTTKVCSKRKQLQETVFVDNVKYRMHS